MESTSLPSSLRILVVDDEPAVLEVISLFLHEDGHLVETATNGEEALERFQSGTWDIVITDRVMPGMGGCQLVSAIKQLAPQMPVLMVSGFINANSAMELESTGVDALVRKPFTLSSLRNGINQARARHRTRQQAA